MKRIRPHQVEYDAKGLYYRTERKAFSIFNQSPKSVLNASFPHTAARHETQQALEAQEEGSSQTHSKASTEFQLQPDWQYPPGPQLLPEMMKPPLSTKWVCTTQRLNDGFALGVHLLMGCTTLQLEIFGIAFNGYWTFFYWSIVNLQGCFSFKYIAKWFHFIDIYVYFLRFFSIRDYYQILSIFPCVIQ